MYLFAAATMQQEPKAESGAMDNNLYQQRKNLAQGMMDLSLIIGNTAELRYILDAGPFHPYYYQGIVLISFSVFLQIAVGIGLIIIYRHDMTNALHVSRVNRINDFILIGTFFIIICNIFVSAFIATNPQSIKLIDNISVDELIGDKPGIGKARFKQEL